MCENRTSPQKNGKAYTSGAPDTRKYTTHELRSRLPGCARLRARAMPATEPPAFCDGVPVEEAKVLAMRVGLRPSRGVRSIGSTIARVAAQLDRCSSPSKSVS